MRASLLVVLVASAALTLAGCLGAPAPAPPAEQPTPTAHAEPPVVEVAEPAAEPAAHLATFPYEGRLTAGAGVAEVGYLTPTGNSDTHAYAFHVGEGAMAIVAELAWADRSQDLDLEVGTPDCDTNVGQGVCVFADGGNPGAGDSPVRIVITDPEMLRATGDWKLIVWGKNAVNLDFHGAVTVFYGTMPEEGYTALDG